MLQVTQSAVDDARGTAGYSGGEIILLDQQGVLAGACALPRYGYAVDAPRSPPLGSAGRSEALGDVLLIPCFINQIHKFLKVIMELGVGLLTLLPLECASPSCSRER